MTYAVVKQALNLRTPQVRHNSQQRDGFSSPRGDVTTSNSEWEIWCDGDQYRQHLIDSSFPMLLTLARIVNNLRYHHVSTIPVRGEDSPSAVRQRITSFLNVAGSLYEALLFSERLGEFFRDDPAFQDVHELLCDKEVQTLRSGPLRRLRHQVVYHHDASATAEAVRMMADGDKYVFASGTTFSKADVYYELADIAVFHYALPDSGDGRAFPQRLRDLFTRAAAVAIRFGNAADKLIAGRLKENGWRTSRAA